MELDAVTLRRGLDQVDPHGGAINHQPIQDGWRNVMCVDINDHDGDLKEKKIK
jgi:hypothetical protein